MYLRYEHQYSTVSTEIYNLSLPFLSVLKSFFWNFVKSLLNIFNDLGVSGLGESVFHYSLNSDVLVRFWVLQHSFRFSQESDLSEVTFRAMRRAIWYRKSSIFLTTGHVYVAIGYSFGVPFSWNDIQLL